MSLHRFHQNVSYEESIKIQSAAKRTRNISLIETSSLKDVT